MLLKFHRLPIHGQSSDLAGNLWDHESRLNEASPWATSPLILPPDQCWANSSLVSSLRLLQKHTDKLGSLKDALSSFNHHRLTDWCWWCFRVRLVTITIREIHYRSDSMRGFNSLSVNSPGINEIGLLHELIRGFVQDI